MLLLALAWLALLVYDLVKGLTPFLYDIFTGIWIVFIIDFIIRLLLAPKKFEYLKKNWLMILSLIIPAFRIFRILAALRIFTVIPVARLARVVTSLHRSINSLRALLREHGFIYIVIITALVIFAGAGGIYTFEGNIPEKGAPHDFGTALWWAAMMITTMGSGYWPVTPEGRILCFLLALYSFSVFGYVTAVLATFLIDEDTGKKLTRNNVSLESLQREIAALRDELKERNSSKPGQ